MSTSFLERHHHLLRRLHSLAGIVPIGLFLIMHLLTNSSLIWGKFGLRGEQPDLGVQEGGAFYFQKEVGWINTQIPHLILIEATLWGAILFHGILGFYYAATGSSNTHRYAFGGNWRYKLQRISGYIGFVFILYHMATLRWGWTFLMPGGVAWDHKFAASTLNHALLGGSTVMDIGLALLYVIGVSMLVFHFANGLWTAAITWGLTVTAGSQKRWGYVCAGLGAALMLMAWGAIAGAMALDPAKVKAVEREAGHASVLTEQGEWLAAGGWNGEMDFLPHPENALARRMRTGTDGYPWPGTEKAVVEWDDFDGLGNSVSRAFRPLGPIPGASDPAIPDVRGVNTDH